MLALQSERIERPQHRGAAPPRVTTLFATATCGQGAIAALSTLGFVAVVVVQLSAAHERLESDQAHELWIAAMCLACLCLAEVALDVAIRVTNDTVGWLKACLECSVDLAVAVMCLVLVACQSLVGVQSILLMRVTRLMALTQLRTTWAEPRNRSNSVVPTALPELPRAASFTSPMERGIRALQQLLSNSTLSAAQRTQIRSTLDALRSGDLYRPIHDALSAASSLADVSDPQTAGWLKAEYATAIHQATSPIVRRAGTSPAVLRAFGFQADSPSLMATRQRPGGAIRRRSNQFDNLSDAPSATSSLQSVRSPPATSGWDSRVHVFQALQGSENAHSLLLSVRADESTSSTVEHRRELAFASLWNLAKRNLKLQKLRRLAHSWMFDVMVAVETSQGRPLFLVTYNLFGLHGVANALQLEFPKLCRLLTAIESGYLTNPYHNATHAADVVQTTHYFLSQPVLLNAISPLEMLSALLAAAVHDYAHPGVSNAFEIATRSARALQYNDQAVLENMHSAAFFEMVSKDDLNILQAFSAVDYRRVRQLMISMVLGTDMAKHFEDVAKLKARLVGLELPNRNAPIDTSDVITNAADCQFYLQMALHTADISHPAKPLKWHKRWAAQVLEEFYAQGDRERELGLPITPLFDRHSPNEPKLQLGFVDYIVAPLFNEWALLIPDVHTTVMPLLAANRRYWSSQAGLPAIKQTIAGAVTISLPTSR